ncbi:DUF397 domain-containing protein [Streptomyces sp. NPDC059443]|uniref:DUF397 domain-containing protein n=1 Tax=unclassified Streptomyces TaxID=2593676 RepID=UPI0036B4D6B6
MSIKPSTGGPSELTWVKSSYSPSDSNDCVEVAWVKSSYSTNDGPECVEVAMLPESILIRDSKDVDRTHLAVAPTAWTGFVRYAAG